MQALVDAVVSWLWLKREGPRVLALDVRPGRPPQLIAGTAHAAAVIVLDERRLRKYARRFDFDRARRWVLHEVRAAAAA